MRIHLLLASFLIPFSLFLANPASAQSLPSCGVGEANGLADGDIDHYDLVCFTSIPDSYITNAANMDFLWVDRSVGANIHDALNCLSSGLSFASASIPCKQGLASQDYISHTKYNRSKWFFAHYGDGGWYDSVSRYILNDRLIDANRNPYSPNYSSFDVINFQFSYLSVMDGQTIANNTNGFFVPYPGNTNQIKDIHDIVAFEATLPNATHVYATTSLARTIGTSVSESFNNQMRQYTEANNVLLIDFADIGSHDPQGNLCTYNGFAELCADYTTETVGGHLSQGIALQRVARAMWLLMTGIAGWVPGSNVTPPPATITPIATITPVATITNTPAPPPQTYDFIDLLNIIRNFGQNLVDIFRFNEIVSNFN